MYELSNPVHIKDLMVFNRFYLKDAYDNGVDIGALNVNIHIYECDDPALVVKYLKMICNLIKIFRNIYDNNLYLLRIKGFMIDYSSINFHDIFNAINNKFNSYIDDEFLFYEFYLYHSEISLDTSMAMYDTFNEAIIESLKTVIRPDILKFIFNLNSMTHINEIYDSIFNQLDEFFSIL